MIMSPRLVDALRMGIVLVLRMGIFIAMNIVMDTVIQVRRVAARRMQ